MRLTAVPHLQPHAPPARTPAAAGTTRPPIRRSWSRSAGKVMTAAAVVLVTLGGCTPDRGPTARVGLGVVTTTTTTIPVDPEIEDVVAGAGMTDLGRQLFLSAFPSVEDADTLAQSCADVDVAAGPDGSHTFGCLINGHIHLRSFAEDEVRDLIYVVAAHELLHVVYGRLTRSERLALDPELDFARGGNTLLEERLQVYAAVSEDTPNEVHSLLGTEFPDLSPVLEEHFATYFDRERVLEVFRRTLGDREDEIRALKASIEDMEVRLDDLQAQLDRLDADGDIDGYNATVNVFNELVTEHNAAVRHVNALVDEDNRLTA